MGVGKRLGLLTDNNNHCPDNYHNFKSYSTCTAFLNHYNYSEATTGFLGILATGTCTALISK